MIQSISLKSLVLDHKACTRVSQLQQSKEGHLFVTLLDQSVTPTKSACVWFTKPTEAFLRSEGFNSGDVLPPNVLMKFEMFKLQNGQQEDRFKLHTPEATSNGKNKYSSLVDMFGGEELTDFNVSEFLQEFSSKPEVAPKDAPKEETSTTAAAAPVATTTKKV